MQYLLDTNTVIDYLNAALPPTAMQRLGEILDNESIISVVTKIETLGYNFENSDELFIMETFVNASVVLIRV